VVRRAVVSWDVVFDEQASWSWEEEYTGLDTNLVVEYQALQLGIELPGAPP
jgi:hypothetical protein